LKHTGRAEPLESASNVYQDSKEVIMQTSSVLAAPVPLASGTQVYQQSSNDFVKDIAACLIKKLNRYLVTNIKRNSSLQLLLPLVKRSVELYIGGRLDESITQSFQAYVFIETLGTSVPPLGTAP